MPTEFTRPTGPERREWALSDLEVREGSDGMTFSGYAAVFNRDSEPLPFIERVLPGAFRRSLNTAGKDIRLLGFHDASMPLARRKNGTLRLAEDDHGLRVEATLPGTSAGRDVAELLRRGDIDSMSFGFNVPPKGDRWPDESHRELVDVNLHEVSVVTWPAYTATSASVRSLDDLAARLLADRAALGAAIDKLAAGEALTMPEHELLGDAICDLAQCDCGEDEQDAQAIPLSTRKARLRLMELAAV